jgi:hypothetical protein
MSDYLNNIVARTMGIADVVQPRLALLFEGSGHYQTESRDLFFDTFVERPRTAPLSIEPTASQPDRAVPSTVIIPPVERAEGPVAVKSQTFEAIPEKPSSMVAVDQARTIDPGPLKQMSSSPAAVPRQLERRSQQVLGHAPSPPSRKAVSVNAIRHQASRPAAPTQHPLAMVALPSTTRSEHLEQSTTAIKITIGRVDVRAILPAATPSRPTPTRPKPALSLESYLKEREQGKR